MLLGVVDAKKTTLFKLCAASDFTVVDEGLQFSTNNLR
jgi:hypothetical protein